MGQTLSCFSAPVVLSKKTDLASLVETVKQEPKLLGTACLSGKESVMHVLARHGHSEMLQEVLRALEAAHDSMLSCHSPGCITAARHQHSPALECYSSPQSQATAPPSTLPCELCKYLCSQCRGRPALPEKWQLANLLNARHQTPLMIAAAQGHADVVRILLSLGADPMAVDKTDGCTALHYASLYGHTHCVKLLLEALERQAAGQPPEPPPASSTSAARSTAITGGDMARQSASPAVAADTGGGGTQADGAGGSADGGHDDSEARDAMHRLVNHMSLTGASALHLASDAGHEEVVRLLCAHGADINAILRPQGFRWFVVHQGATPLHLAAEQGHMGVALALLKHFRDHEQDSPGLIDPRTQQDRAGLRPHQLAFLSHHFRVARVIRPSFPLSWLFDSNTGGNKSGVPSLSQLAARAVMTQLCSQLDAMATQGQQEQHTSPTHPSPPPRAACEVHWWYNGSAACDEVQSAADCTCAADGHGMHAAEGVSKASGEDECDVCFERGCCVRLQPCDHVLCVGCAKRVCGSMVDKPAPCPFCRGHILGFLW